MITYNSQRNEFVVTAGNKTAYLKPKGKLYVYRALTLCTNEGTVVVSTVEENIKGLTKREVEQAKLARQLQIRLGYPSVSDILEGIKNGRILNSPVLKQDFKNAIRIWGKDLGSIKGKTIRTKPDRVIVETINVSVDKEVVLCADIFYISGICKFLLSISLRLTLLIATHLKDRTEASVREALMAHVSIYKSRGFAVKMILFDGEGAVASATTYLQETGITVNTTVKNEHIPEVERAGHQL